MAEEGASALVRRHVMEVVNQQDLGVVDEIYHPDLVFNDPFAPGGVVRGYDGLKGFLRAVYTAFPDFHFTPIDFFGGDDHGAWHGTVSGTLQHEFAGIPARGQHVEAPICEVFHVRGEKIAEVWVYVDTASLLHQLGATGS